MEVNRHQLLDCLQFASKGLSKKGTVPQSDCFVFTEDRILTFNDEISCSTENPLGKSCLGAVPAASLLGLLRLLPGEQVVIQQEDQIIRVRPAGSRRSSKLTYEKDLRLPVAEIEAANDWSAFPAESFAAIDLAASVCSKTRDEIFLSSVHFSSSYIEATDGSQAVRWNVPLGPIDDVLLIRDAAEAVSDFRPTEVACCPAWAHFRRDGRVLSCRRYAATYPDLSSLFAGEGVSFCFGEEDMESVVARLQIFEESEDSEAEVLLQDGKFQIRMQGRLGQHAEEVETGYQGEAIRFRIRAERLLMLSRFVGSPIQVCDSKLLVATEDCRFVTCIML